MQTQTPMNTPQEDDELSVWDAVDFFKDGWCWVARRTWHWVDCF